MEKIIKDILTDLGLSEKEVRFFIANYLTGPTNINEIIKQAKIERSTAYLIAQTLIQKGYLIEDYKQYKKTLSTVDPQTLLRMLSTKQRQIGRHELLFKEHLAELQAHYQLSEVRPRVRTYEGNQGLLSVWRDILMTSEEVLLWTNQETEKNMFSEKYHNLFIAERVKKNIPMRAIAVNNEKGKRLVKDDFLALRQTKLLPKNVSFSAETYIYENKLAILDYNKEIIGIIIENKQIVESQKAVFEMTWKNLS